VTLKGGYERRPDIVLYINGLAIAMIELKRSSVELADGVRQLITNQEEIFNKALLQHGATRAGGQRLARAPLRHHRYTRAVLSCSGKTKRRLGRYPPPGDCSTGRSANCATRPGCST
jgi:hypothetical protein